MQVKSVKEMAAMLKETLMAGGPWPLVVALVLLVLTTLYFIWRRYSSKGDTILLVGLVDSGKTALFGKLIRSENVWRVYSSTKENIYTEYYTDGGSRYKLVDYPGADSMRKGLFSNWISPDKKNLRGIIFVVDSSTIAVRAKDVAEFLYDILFECPARVPLLAACNKQDIVKAKTSMVTTVSAPFVRDVLEKEFGMINVSREAALSTTSGDADKRLLASTGAKFQWGDLRKRKGRFDFVECSAVEDSDFSFEPVRQWVDSI